jgi:tripartite-type tricarboxylate transporter receptor subunit TctC
VTDLAKNDEDRQIMKIVFGSQEMARPFLAPPNVPADRLAALRKAFEDTSRDAAFLSDARRENIPINLATWQELDDLIKDVYSIPKPVVERAAMIINGQ